MTDEKKVKALDEKELAKVNVGLHDINIVGNGGTLKSTELIGGLAGSQSGHNVININGNGGKVNGTEFVGGLVSPAKSSTSLQVVDNDGNTILNWESFDIDVDD